MNSSGSVPHGTSSCCWLLLTGMLAIAMVIRRHSLKVESCLVETTPINYHQLNPVTDTIFFKKKKRGPSFNLVLQEEKTMSCNKPSCSYPPAPHTFTLYQD
mmetsp:Transcript_75926/g.203422  ORF Transcript_75926/g.203422 Transcript_75926/m.203422 type:complete len:101 (-) Transcript_75926:19-321(-)